MISGEFGNFLRTLFLTEHVWRLLLVMEAFALFTKTFHLWQKVQLIPEVLTLEAPNPEEYSEPCQTYKMTLFVKIFLQKAPS